MIKALKLPLKRFFVLHRAILVDPEKDLDNRYLVDWGLEGKTKQSLL